LKPYRVKALPTAHRAERPPKQDFHAEVNGMLQVLKTDCQWRMLPKDFPPWQAAPGCFRRWKREGRRDRVLKALRESARRKAGRNREPTVAIMDSRPVRSAGKGAARLRCGRQGRKPRLAVDAMGFLLAAVVHSAGIPDRAGARALLIRRFRRITGIRKIFAGGGYTGKWAAWTTGLFAAVMEIVKRGGTGQFVVLPRRWMVERTFVWLTLSRRLDRDDEINPQHSETMIQPAMNHLPLKRLSDF
jgi:putative transposase